MAAATSTNPWSATARPEIVDELLWGLDRFNPSNVPILEDYLYQQTRSGEYDCLANLAVLKLYQFNVDIYNPDVVVNTLIKALTAAPLPDFNLCVSLLDERHVNPANQDEPDPLPALLPLLVRLNGLLQQCRFPAFWEAYRSDEYEVIRDNYTVEVAGFDDAVRQVAIRAVTAAFTRIGAERLASYLQLSGAELEAYVARLGWKQDGSVITIPPNPDNQIQSSVTQENIKLSQLVKVISRAGQVA